MSVPAQCVKTRAAGFAEFYFFFPPRTSISKKIEVKIHGSEGGRKKLASPVDGCVCGER